MYFVPNFTQVFFCSCVLINSVTKWCCTVAAGPLNGAGSVSASSGLSFGASDGSGNMRGRNKITAMQIR